MAVSWIKITTNIFDDEKIKLIDSLPDHDAILVIWIKLLTLAGKCNSGGSLMISEAMPYTDEMLSAIFNRPINTVRLALDTFEKLEMIERHETISIVNWEKHQNAVALETIRIYDKERKRKQRERAKVVRTDCPGQVPDMSRNVRSVDIKDLDLEEDKERREDKTTAPLVAEVENLPPATPAAKPSKEVAVKPKPSPLYHAINQCFLTKTPTFANYAKEAQAIKRIEAFAARYDPGDRIGATLALIEKYWELVESQDKFWHKQPFTPSGLSSMMDRVARELEINRPQTREESERAFRVAQEVPF